MSEIWRFTVDNTNPLLRYLPYGDGSPARGWQAWYDSSGDPVSCGKSSVDGSYHFTSYSGASLELKFSGTEILLYGHANCSYDVRVDNSSYHYTESIPNILFYKKGLHPSTHVVNLTAHPAASQEFVFDRAVVGDATINLSMVTPRMLDHQDMDTFVYVGAWDPVSDNQVPHPEYPQSYHSTSASGAFVRSVFNGSTGLSLTGTRSCKHGTYNISLQESSGRTVFQSEINNTASRLLLDAVLFYWGNLDPVKSYNLTLSNLTPGSHLTLSSLTLYSATSEVQSGTIHRKNIIPLIAPIAAGLFLIIMIVICLWKTSPAPSRINENRLSGPTIRPRGSYQPSPIALSHRRRQRVRNEAEIERIVEVVSRRVEVRIPERRTSSHTSGSPMRAAARISREPSADLESVADRIAQRVGEHLTEMNPQPPTGPPPSYHG